MSPGDAYGFAGLGLFLYNVKTSKSGTYKIANLAAGRYAMDFNGCGEQSYVSRQFGDRPGALIGDIVDVGTAATVRGINAVMSPGGAISGVVRSSTARPVTTGCEVITNLRTGAVTYGGVFSFGTPSYRVPGLAPGRYSVEFYICNSPGPDYAIQWFNRKSSPRTATPVRVTAGRTVRAVDAALPRGGQISGRLTAMATGKPLANLCVDAISRSGYYFGFGFSGRNGSYVVTGLNSGTYRLAISDCDATGTSGAVTNLRLARTVHVTAPRTVGGINAALPAGGSISGTVRTGPHASTGQGGVCVEADPVTAGGLGNSTTSYNGHYRVLGLSAGRYKIFFDSGTFCDDGHAALVPQWYSHAETRAAATVVTVRAGRNTAGIDATLRHDGGISGTVTAASSRAPLSGVCVRAVPRTASRTPSFTASAAGRYSLTGLLPGKYTVEFRSGCGATGYAAQWWHGAASAATATVITVKAGAVTTGISAALKH
jgi:hypothetical protein